MIPACIFDAIWGVPFLHDILACRCIHEVTTPEPTWLERYQTLVASLTAIIPAFIGLGGLIWVTWYNAREQRRLSKFDAFLKRQSVANAVSGELEVISAQLKKLEQALDDKPENLVEKTSQLKFVSSELVGIKTPVTDAVLPDIGQLPTDTAAAVAAFTADLSSVKLIPDIGDAEFSPNFVERLETVLADQVQSLTDRVHTALKSLRAAIEAGEQNG